MGCAWVVIDGAGRVVATTVHGARALRRHNPVAVPPGGTVVHCSAQAGERVALAQNHWAHAGARQEAAATRLVGRYIVASQDVTTCSQCEHAELEWHGGRRPSNIHQASLRTTQVVLVDVERDTPEEDDDGDL